jgi:signal transduction histidine kinase
MESMRRFTSDAAHELRSPVSVLRAEAEIALRKPRDLEEYKKVVEVTLTETVRLGTIIDQLLALCRHDAGLQKLLTDEVPVAAVLLDVVARFHSLALEKEIDVVVKELPECFIRGQDVWLSQLFYNLIDNALKFTQKNGRVVISGIQDNGQVEFTIRDTGIGIAAENLPLVFERFYRADSAREHYRGVGLGLSICKSIVEAHKGTIEVTSNVGKGTVFTVRFPTLSTIETYSESAIMEASSTVPARSSSPG